MAWREGLTAYLQGRLPSADEVRIVRLASMPAGASNDTVGLDLSVRCDGHEFEVPALAQFSRFKLYRH